jgi:hypothetical protein
MDVNGGAPILINQIGPVGYKTASADEVSVGINRRQAMLGRERDD